MHARVNQFTQACCLAGSLAWTSDQVGLLGLAQPDRAELDVAPKIKENIKKKLGMGLGPSDLIPFILVLFILIFNQNDQLFPHIVFRVFHCIFDL